MKSRISEKLNQLINRNIGFKLTFLMVPMICVVMTITTMLINYMYRERFIANIEEGSQYLTETFKLNVDFCTNDAKSLLNTLSLDQNVITLVTMDREHMNYGTLLNAEKEVKKLLGSMTSVKSYVQDVFVIGENGYQYNYLSAMHGNIMEQGWFIHGVEKGKRGFQYILPHDVDYYEQGKRPAGQAISIVLPIKAEGGIAGYAIVDIKMDKAGALPEGLNRNTNMKAYLVDGGTKDYYDFQTKQGVSGVSADFMQYVGNQKSDFLRADDYFIVYSKMESSDWYVAAVYLYKDIIASAMAAQKIGFAMLLISCGVIVVVARKISASVKRPIDDIICRMQEVEEQNFEPMEVENTAGQPGEIILIRKKLEEMVRRINELVHKVYLDEIYRKNMEYDNLVNQMNPHFIYNVLQLIQAKAVFSENDEIDEIVVALSRLMRYTMSNNDKLVTLKEEYSYVESYLDLYEKRYSHKFSYEMYLEPELETFPVLKFILQPVVENCMKHGFKNLKREGRVRVDISRKGDCICFRVEDNGNGIPAEKLEELNQYIEDEKEGKLDAIGLRNTCQRMKLTYGEKAFMRIESVEKQYTVVELSIPADRSIQEKGNG